MFVVVLLVNEKGEFLIGRRRDNRKWTTPAGHLNEGESKEDGARRETLEESNILITQKLEHLHSDDNGVHLFTASVDSNRVTASGHRDPDKEVIDWRWVRRIPSKWVLHVPRSINILYTSKQVF